MKKWITDPEVDSRLSSVSASHLFVASPEEYMILFFWEMTSGCFLFSALLVSTVDTYSASVHGCFWKNLVFLCVREPGSRGLPIWFALGNLNIISTSSPYDVRDGFFAVKCGIFSRSSSFLEWSARGHFSSPRRRRVLRCRELHGWRGRRELAPRCSSTRIRCI